MAFSIADIPDQTGRVAIVTGGTAGLGLQSVIALARKGCHVIFTARNATRGQEALDKIQATIAPASCKVEYGIADNEDLASVAAFADAFLARNLPLHILLLNAGRGFGPYQAIHGVESMLFNNHVAHQLLAIRLLPVLKSSAPSRVVIVSSGLHALPTELDLDLPSEDKYNSMTAYGTSKVANILMGHGLLKQIGSAKVYVNSLHPGLVATPTPEKQFVLTQFPGFIGRFLGFLLKTYLRWFGVAPETGALTQLYLATSPEVEKNEWQGQYFTPLAKLDKATPLSRDPVQVERLWSWTNDVINRVLSKN
ncbi:unnamed protein product [Aphanomyces euteiches]|uniref:NAD(P)-binding protein n=1 Tax=Aphanomyces euteiches TaxID=100861 RepID=A0A6G0WRK3_9STRA|nr:hypothetical protein Ae201684_012440 [Aphanomyces euteiches]KAH9090373.1 hypothetical protein Ae201684P_014176 [Aphanomyces euteiches]KAH9142144.1 hypothetical protein AeRB84_013763 [Aphanomyces euteiches]